MRKIFPSVSAMSARAVLASAVLLAGTSFLPAHAQELQSFPVYTTSDDETAFAKARSASSGEIMFPRPLSAASAAQYRLIFHVLREGNLQAAEAHTRLLQDHVLLSDVLAEQYLHSLSHPRAEALQRWLKAYSHLPDSPAIEDRLAQIRGGHSDHTANVRVLKRGKAPSLPDSSASHQAMQTFSRNAALEHTVQDRASHGMAGADSALRLIDATPGMNRAYAAQLYGDVALSLLSQGLAREALRIGSRGFTRGGQHTGFPAFVGGLAAWHEGHMEAAYLLFEAAANAVMTDSEIQAASSFWAARIEARRHRSHDYVLWLRRAATHTTSFYGLLAAQLLKEGRAGETRLSHTVKSFAVRPTHLALGEVDIVAVMSMTEGCHLFALLQIGEQGRAEALMRSMWPDVVTDPVRARSLQLVARQAGMTELAGQMADILDQINHQNLKKTLTPLPRLKPAKGFRFDPALVYAVVHTESNFNAGASSSVGALGMMQIRPLTASFVTMKHISFDAHGVAVIPVPPDMPQRLYNPAYNLEIGQLYMLYLADAVSKAGGADTAQGGDVLRVLASYNAGPQAVIRWETLQSEQHDPLYFVETLPSPETRRYVHKVMTTTWIYARRLGLASPSLSTLAEARWPSFQEEQMVRRSPS